MKTFIAIFILSMFASRGHCENLPEPIAVNISKDAGKHSEPDDKIIKIEPRVNSPKDVQSPELGRIMEAFVEEVDKAEDNTTENSATEDNATEGNTTENITTEDNFNKDDGTEDKEADDKAPKDKTTESNATEDKATEDNTTTDAGQDAKSMDDQSDSNSTTEVSEQSSTKNTNASSSELKEAKVVQSSKSSTNASKDPVALLVQERMNATGNDSEETERSLLEEIRQRVMKERRLLRESMIMSGDLDAEENLNLTLGDTTGEEISCKVLILGAGISGITAAKTLKGYGIDDFKIVEGADRMGGRLKEVMFGGINVEVGGNWVHFSGMTHDDINPVEELVKKSNLTFVSDDYSDYIFRFKGKNVTDEANEAFERLNEAIKKTQRRGEQKVELREPDLHYRVALALEDWRSITPIEKAVEYFTFDFEFGDEPQDIGLKENYETFATHGKDDMFIADKRGFSQIVRDLADEIGLEEGKNLYLNEFVTKIHYMEKGSQKVKVETRNKITGETNIFRAEAVIVTFSIGVLQSSMVKFIPPLPDWKLETIYMFKMIRYIKIFVKFPDNITAFWDDNHYILHVDPHVRGHYQFFQNLEARGKYFPKGTNMLLVTVIGNNWDRVQTLSKETVKKEIFEVLKSMYGDKAVEPEDILIPDWHHNPLFFGAYSNWPIGVSRRTYQNLDAPVGPLYMAGEACSGHFHGFIHGAIESGENTATSVVKCLELRECEYVPKGGYGYGESCK